MIDKLDTPSLVIDTKKMEDNVRRMADIAKRNSVQLRPHAKTHKIPRLAKKQLEAGAAGITVAKVSEAEVMANHGIGSIFIAYPLIAGSKIERAVRLSEKIHLIIGVDSIEGAMRLEETAKLHGHVLKVRLEIDTGLRRTGVSFDDAIRLGKQIQALEHLELTGIFTYRGVLLDNQPTLDVESAGIQEGRVMVQLAERMRAEGIPIHDVSVGSTPTSPYASTVNGVTEIRPGTYIFYDRMQAAFGACTLEQCAGTVWTTVVSRPSDELMIIDGGSKTFATDVQPNTNPLQLRGFGHIVEAPDAVLERMNEEHGMVRVGKHHPFKVGDRIRIIPNHICSTVNLHNQVVMADGDQIEEVTVLGRGMLE